MKARRSPAGPLCRTLAGNPLDHPSPLPCPAFGGLARLRSSKGLHRTGRTILEKIRPVAHKTNALPGCLRTASASYVSGSRLSPTVSPRSHGPSPVGAGPPTDRNGFARLGGWQAESQSASRPARWQAPNATTVGLRLPVSRPLRYGRPMPERNNSSPEKSLVHAEGVKRSHGRPPACRCGEVARQCTLVRQTVVNNARPRGSRTPCRTKPGARRP